MSDEKSMVLKFFKKGSVFPKHYSWRHLFLQTPSEVMINTESIDRERIIAIRENEMGSLYEYASTYYKQNLPKNRVVAIFG